MSVVEGVYANHALLTIINDLVGKEVLVEAVDGAKYSGIFCACSPEFDIGLRHAYKITTGNSENLLPKREDMTAKMLFKFSDIVAMSALMNEEKVIRGFATDRDYHTKQQNGRLDGEEHELQEWSADEDGEEIEPLDDNHMRDPRQRYQRNNGWNVEEMFSTNSQMGVQSTYEEDLRQYTTAPVEGSEEDRRRADQIAREIENSQQSKFAARLENDDDERDLDKATTEDDFELQSKRGGGTGGRGNFTNRNQRNGANGPPLGNRRADALKGGQDRRGGGTPGRYPTQQHNANTPQNRGMPGNKYEQRPRPTGQELQDSFNEFSLKEGNSRRDPSQGQTTRTYENKNQSQSNKILLEPRSSASPRGAPTDPKSQPGAAARRADGLRGWNQEFNNNYRPEGKVDTPRESPARPVLAAPSGNAWARGPPTSVTNAHNSSQRATPTPASPPHAVETSPQDPMPSSTNDQQVEAAATTSSPRTDGSSPATASVPAPSTQTTSHEATPDSTTTSATTEKEEGTKKFTFNINAEPFKPRSAQTQIQAQQIGPPPGGPPQAMMGAMVPPGVSIQTAMPPPGMLSTMQTGQPPVLVQWQGPPGQQATYQIPPSYQYVVTGGQAVSMMSSQPITMGARTSGPPAVAFQGGRRQVMVPPHTAAAQWPPHVMQVGQGMVPYAYQSFPVQAGASGGGGAGVVPAPPPQGGFPGTQAPPPQMMAGTPQAGAPPPGIYQQRFVPAQGYVLPQAGIQGQTRFPTPQQTPHQGMEAAHYQGQGAPGSAAASTGPNSQPPTPGPSPAQGRGGSPGGQQAMQQSVGPPPPQQFMAQASAAPPPHFYAAQPVYGMYSTPAGQGMVVYGGPGGVPMTMPPTHHDPTMMQQPHPQQTQQQQQAGGVPPPPHQQYTMPHEGYSSFVQAAPFYQQPPPNQMSRQNSAPQSMYQQQGPGGPPPQQQQQAPPNPPSTAPPQQQ